MQHKLSCNQATQSAWAWLVSSLKHLRSDDKLHDVLGILHNDKPPANVASRMEQLTSGRTWLLNPGDVQTCAPVSQGGACLETSAQQTADCEERGLSAGLSMALQYPHHQQWSVTVDNVHCDM